MLPTGRCLIVTDGQDGAVLRMHVLEEASLKAFSPQNRSRYHLRTLDLPGVSFSECVRYRSDGARDPFLLPSAGCVIELSGPLPQFWQES